MSLTSERPRRSFDTWLSALEARHLASLRVAEVTPALRALSSAYVERRHALATGGALDTAGKRAAFALFYGPLHYMTVARVLAGLGDVRKPRFILDLGCGTGAAGAAWAVERARGARVLGIDRHPWAVAEARWTYQQFGLHGQARVGNLSRLPRLDRFTAVVAAYVLNELPAERRESVIRALLEGAARGAQVLVLEPLARGVAPWWDEVAARVTEAGGSVGEWRFAGVDLPPLVRLLDRAAGLDHRELTVRTFSLNAGDEDEW